MKKILKFKDIDREPILSRPAKIFKKRPFPAQFTSNFYSKDLEKSIKGIYKKIKETGDCSHGFWEEASSFCGECYYATLDLDHDWNCALKRVLSKHLNEYSHEEKVLEYITKMCEKHLKINPSKN
jgi:hypothetical protein